MALFGRKKSEPKDPVFITAQLNARLQPLDRGYFEDPLDDLLKRLRLGEVDGGGTQLADEPAGIAYCDIELRLNEISAEAVSTIVRALEDIGAPKGSKLILNGMPDAAASTNQADRQIFQMDETGAIPFGKFEGLGLFLNGTDLPADVYKNSDSNELFEECRRLMGEAHKYDSYWNGSRETALYFYGPSFERMKTALNSFVVTEPLCEMCRIEQIA